MCIAAVHTPHSCVTTSLTTSHTGLTVGFAAGLALVFGTEKLGALLEGKDEVRRARGAVGARRSRRFGCAFASPAPFLSPQSAASVPQWSPHDARESAVQLLAEDHRAHLQMHLDEFAEAVAHVDAQASALVAPSISVAEEENASEAIDEARTPSVMNVRCDKLRRLTRARRARRCTGCNTSWTTAGGCWRGRRRVAPPAAPRSSTSKCCACA